MAYDHGSKRVQQRRQFLSNGRDPAQCFDNVGVLWCFGVFDGQRLESELLRDAGRRYAELYWSMFGTAAAKTGNLELVSRATGQMTTIETEASVIREGIFRLWDETLVNTGRKARKVVHQVCVNQHGVMFPAWMHEMINEFHQRTIHSRSRISELSLRKRQAKNQKEKSSCDSAMSRERGKIRQAWISCSEAYSKELLSLNLGLLAIGDQFEGRWKAEKLKRKGVDKA